MNRHQISTAVDLATNVFSFSQPFDRDRQFHRNMAVVGVEIDIRGQVLRYLQRNASISGS